MENPTDVLLVTYLVVSMVAGILCVACATPSKRGSSQESGLFLMGLLWPLLFVATALLIALVVVCLVYAGVVACLPRQMREALRQKKQYEPLLRRDQAIAARSMP